jgi:phosphofructokinase-like protein
MRGTAGIRKIGVLTGGGDAPGLNPVLRAIVHRALGEYGWEVWGSEDGMEGLIQPPRCRKMQRLSLASVADILPRGGSFLGCSKDANPWAYPRHKRGGKVEFVDVHAQVLRHVQHYGLDALLMIGGDGTMTMARRFADLGLQVVGVPKTIDNDLSATDYTFGFDTAVATATWAIDTLHATAHAHDRVLIVELMGRSAGWIALSAGIAGGAHVILLPEIPYDIGRVVRKIRSLGGRYSSYCVIVVAEGAKPKGGEVSIVAKGREGHLARLGGAGQRVADALSGRVAHEVRVTVLGHLQRGGSPTAFDRILGTRLGTAAVDLAAHGGFGRMVCLRTPYIESVPFEEAIGHTKLVDPTGELVRTARAMGIELGA